MRSYETVVVMKPDLQAEEIENNIKSIKDYLEKNKCEIVKEENWGKKKLAYEIDKYKEGAYYYIAYTTDNYAVPKELEKSFNLNENILRYISVKLEDKQASNKKHITSSHEKNKSEEQKEEISTREEQKSE
jgi:small subunit ribosomal protein S6